MSGSSLFGLFGALAVTGGLLIIVLRLLQRVHGKSLGRSRIPFDVVQRHALGPKQGLLVVRVGRRVLVLGTSEHGPRLLTELKGEDRLQVLGAEEEAPAPAPVRAPHALQRILAQFSLILVLGVMGTGALQAQVQAPARPAHDSGVRSAISPPTSVAPRVRQPSGPLPDNLKIKAPTAPTMELKVGRGNEELKLSGTVGLVVFMGALTLLPAVFLLMTSFTRILIVLHFLRSALGTQSSPPGQLLVAIAVLLTGVVMTPVVQEANRTALQPYFDGQISQVEAYTKGIQPFRHFMLANVREKDLATFTELSGASDVASVEDLPTLTIMSAFVTSELQAAFWMGFVIFVPFVVVDLLVATTLMSLGMFMLPPVMISLPFKLLLFVLADGWSLVGQNLVSSFHR